MDTGYIFEQKCMSQKSELMCIAHFENNWVHVLEASGREVRGRPAAADPQHPLLAVLELETRCVVFKRADRHICFSHLGIIVALRVYILMVKVKKIIIMKSYFEDGRPSNQSVFRQCVFTWTFIYKYLFVIASLKRLSVLYYYLSSMYLYIEKKCTFLAFTCHERKKKQHCFFLSIVLMLLFFLVLVL